MLAIGGAAGGVGRTTLALGLAAALEDRGRSPVVLDADRGAPDLHAIAGCPCRPGIRALARGRPLEAAATTVDGIRMVTARPGTAVQLRRVAIAALARLSDPVLLDCPAGIGRDAGLPLAAADRAVVVATPSPRGVRGAATAERMARSLATPVAGAIVTGAANVASLQPVLDSQVLGSIPPADDPLAAGVCEAEYARVTNEYIYQYA